MRRISPGRTPGRASRMAGARGRRCAIRLDAAPTRRMPNGSAARFCWNSKLRSIVTSASYPPRMRCRRSPFFTPAQARPTTVSTWWPRSAAARSTGRCSSRRTRTSQQRSTREVEYRDRLLASHRRKLPKELVERLAAFKVVEERLHRHPCVDKHGRSAEDLRIAANDISQCFHLGRSQGSLRLYMWPGGARVIAQRRPNITFDLTAGSHTLAVAG